MRKYTDILLFGLLIVVTLIGVGLIIALRAVIG